MNTLLLGLLAALSLLQMFRLKSWVISAAVLMLLTSVTLSITTDFHVINQAVSILIMMASVVSLQQPNLRFGDLLSLNVLLFIHVIAAYISDTSAVVMSAIFITLYLLVSVFKNRPWFDWLITLGLIVGWLIFGVNHYWLFGTVVYSIYLLQKESKINTLKISSK